MTLINLPPDKGRYQALIHRPALHGRLSGNGGPITLRDYLPAMHNDDREGVAAAFVGLGEGGIQSGTQSGTQTGTLQATWARTWAATQTGAVPRWREPRNKYMGSTSKGG